MNVDFPASRSKWPNRILNLVVVIVVLGLAAATFALSYSGVHAIVLQAGVSTRLARIYPWLFDAVFVIACIAAVTLRNASSWVLLYAWLVIILMVAVVGAADVVHATSISLPHRTIEGVVAAAPWVLLLLGFSLMLAMFRQSRVQAAEPDYLAQEPAPYSEADSVPDTRALPVGVWEPQSLPEPESAETAVDEGAAGETGPAEPAGEEPVTAPAAEEEPVREPEPVAEPVAVANGDGGDGASVAAEPEDSVPTAQYSYWDSGADGGLAGPDRVPTGPGEALDDDAPPFATAPFAAVPQLNRVRSTPTPPEDGDEVE